MSRFAVIDLGSNGLRLVIYDRLSLGPFVLHTEKLFAGLGRDLEKTRMLNPEGVQIVMTNLRRFASLIKGMKVEQVEAVATAALRDATNGRELMSAIHQETGIKFKILSEEQEAKITALGVMSAIQDADGVVGDLGGGSLELIDIREGQVRNFVSLPLGTPRLEAIDRRDRASYVKGLLNKIDWLKDLEGRSFYIVGGSWRRLADLHIKTTGYPLQIVHNYHIGFRQAYQFIQKIRRMSTVPFLEFWKNKRKAENLPLAALVLEKILEIGQPKDLVVSAAGLREGCLYQALSPDEQRKDALIAACESIERRQSREGFLGQAFFDWIAPLYPARDVDSLTRLRLAAAKLSDLSWHQDPLFRPMHVYRRIMTLSIVGIDHFERLYLALALAVRYGGKIKDFEDDVFRRLLPDNMREDAILTGLALYLAHGVAAGVPELLDQTSIRVYDNEITLKLRDNPYAMDGAIVDLRLSYLADFLNKKPIIQVLS